MSAEIDDLVGKFEARRLSRRELVAALLGLVASGGAVPAAAQEGGVANTTLSRSFSL